MVVLNCHRCEHDWDYQGNSDYYATCPNCKTTVTINGETVSDGPFDELAGFGVKCDYGTWKGPDLSEADTSATVKLKEYDGDKWIALEMRARHGEYAQTVLSTVFDDKMIAKEFAEKLDELAEEIDSQGTGTERLQ